MSAKDTRGAFTDVPQEMRQWVLSLAPNVAPFSSTFYQTKSINILILFGERAGTRTRDLLIKSQLLYRLSYALAS